MKLIIVGMLVWCLVGLCVALLFTPTFKKHLDKNYPLIDEDSV